MKEEEASVETVRFLNVDVAYIVNSFADDAAEREGYDLRLSSNGESGEIFRAC